MIASGSDQTELRSVFHQRNIARYFPAGIFGSPDSKYKIISRELSLGNIREPTIFFGDSRYDYEVATFYGFKFIFISDWSDLSEWRVFVNNQSIECATSLNALVS